MFFIAPLLWVGEKGSLFSQTPAVDSLKNLIKYNKLDTNKVKCLNNLAMEYYKAFNYDTARYYGNVSLQLSEQLNYKKGTAKVHLIIGITYVEQDNYPQALNYLLKALELNEELNDRRSVAFCLNNIGNIYKGIGNYPQALDYLLKALKLNEELNDKKNIASSLNNIGNIHKSIGNYSKALEYHLKSLKCSEELNDKKAIALSFNNIGLVYQHQHDYSKALDYYQKSLKMNEELNYKKGVAICFDNIGAIYNEQGKYSQALEYSLKTLQLAEELKNKYGIAKGLNGAGNNYIMTKNYKEAEEYLKKAIATSDSIEASDILKDAESSLSKLYNSVGRYKEALIHYQKYTALKDSIFNQEKDKQLVQKQMKFDFDKQEATRQAQHEKEQQKKNFIIVAVALGLLLVVVFAAFILQSLRITRKQKMLLGEQKEVVEKQKEIVQEKQNEIVASINYAKRIQTALLSSDAYIKKGLAPTLSSSRYGINSREGDNHFVLFKPKDIVSGDFYWALSIAPFPNWDIGTNKIKLLDEIKRQNIFYMMTADCTGHGVPGAMMSMLNISYLNENVIERNIRLPHDILNAQRKKIIKALNPEDSAEEAKDGMDCILCAFDFDKMLLHFAAANNPLWLIRNSSQRSAINSELDYNLETISPELIEYKADKMPVGKYNGDTQSFILQTIALQKGDIIYTATDGFGDQFGVNNKKLMKKRLKEELLKIYHLSMTEQKQPLDTFFENWRGDTEQTDDVTVIGIRV